MNKRLLIPLIILFGSIGVATYFLLYGGDDKKIKMPKLLLPPIPKLPKIPTGGEMKLPSFNVFQPFIDVFGGGVKSLVSKGILTAHRNDWKGIIETIKVKYWHLVASGSKVHNIPQALIVAMIVAESSGDPNARRKETYDESLGLMQVLFGTAKGLGYKGTKEGLLDPVTNIHYGCKYLHYLRNKFRNGLFKDWRLAVGAYNAGQGGMWWVTDALKTKDWHIIMISGAKLLSMTNYKRPTDGKVWSFGGFVSTTIPYMRKIFAKNGILADVIKYY